MKHSKIYVLGILSLTLGCGSQSKLSSHTSSHLASEEAYHAGSPEIAPVEGKDLRSQEPSGQTQMILTPAESEMVTAPTPVSGTFLKAKVSADQLEAAGYMNVGLVLHQDGMRVSSLPGRFAFEISLDEMHSPNVRVRKDLLNSSQAEFDKEIRVYASSAAEAQLVMSYIVVQTKLEDKQTKLVTVKKENLAELLRK